MCYETLDEIHFVRYQTGFHIEVHTTEAFCLSFRRRNIYFGYPPPGHCILAHIRFVVDEALQFIPFSKCFDCSSIAIENERFVWEYLNCYVVIWNIVLL